MNTRIGDLEITYVGVVGVSLDISPYHAGKAYVRGDIAVPDRDAFYRFHISDKIFGNISVLFDGEE